MRFPRGTAQDGQNLPTATASWATPDDMQAHSFERGDLVLGYVETAPARAAKTLDQLFNLVERLRAVPMKEPYRSDYIARAIDLIRKLETSHRCWIGTGDDRHAIVLASTRAGKTASTLIPTLCFYPGSVVAIDPKGELARLTSAARGPGSAHCEARGQAVYVLDPYDISGVPNALKASFNPIDLIDPDDPLAVDKASTLAESLVQRTTGEGIHFDETAQMLIKALILFVAVAPELEGRRNLQTVYHLPFRGARLLGLEPDDPGITSLAQLLAIMEGEPAFDGAIAAIAASLSDMGDREYGAVLSTVRRNIGFLERAAIAKVLEHSTFSLHELKSAPNGVSIYLCLPPARMVDCGRWLRAMIGSIIERMYEEDAPPASGAPLLLMLEELATLGHMPVIEQAAGYAAGYHIKMLMVLQDLPQLKRHYPQTWETLLGNAGTVVAFSNSDETTLKYLSGRLGQTEVTQMTTSHTEALSTSAQGVSDAQQAQGVMASKGPESWFTTPLTMLLNQQAKGQSFSQTTNHNQTRTRTPLLTEDEIERHFSRETMQQIVLVKGAPPMAVTRANYFEHDQFLGGYEPARAPYLTLEQANARRAEAKEAASLHVDALLSEADALLKEVNRLMANKGSGT